MVCLVKVSGPAFCPDTPSTGARHLLVDLGQAHQKQEQIHSRELTVTPISGMCVPGRCCQARPWGRRTSPCTGIGSGAGSQQLVHGGLLG